MSGFRWVGYADEDARGRVRSALLQAGYEGDVTFVDSPEGLRASVALDGKGAGNVVVGPVQNGVSDVNLAAAIVCDQQADQVVLVRENASGSLLSRARRAGISDVIDPGAYGPDVGGAVEEQVDGGRLGATATSDGVGQPARVSIASHPERVRGQGAPVLVFCSGRGGTGKSALCVAAAAAAASWGMSVGLVDLDLSCGNAYSYLGLPAGANLSSCCAPGGGFRLPPGLSASEGIRLWGPCGKPEEAELVMPHAGELVSAVARECDLVIVDTSTTFTDAVAQAAQMCDRLLLVSDDRPGGMAALARMAGLAVRLGVARTRIVRVSNRSDPRAKPDLSLGRAEVGLETARIYRVFQSDELPELLSLGQGASLASLGDEFSESVAHLAASILSEMGRLPSCKASEQALRVDGSRQGWTLFGRRREVG